MEFKHFVPGIEQIYQTTDSRTFNFPYAKVKLISESKFIIKLPNNDAQSEWTHVTLDLAALLSSEILKDLEYKQELLQREPSTYDKTDIVDLTVELLSTFGGHSKTPVFNVYTVRQEKTSAKEQP